MAKHSTRRKRKIQGQKPYPDFPLTVRADGRLCKKINSRVFYFGRLDNWQEALERFNHDLPFLVKGRTPPPVDTGGLTIRELCNRFLTSKQAKLDGGEIVQRTFDDYRKTCGLIVSHFGKERRVDDLIPEDFERFRASMSERWGVVSLRNEINRARVVFKFASDQRLIDRPVFYGNGFKRPSAKALRIARTKQPAKMFESGECNQIIDAAGQPLRAMVLLALNCGFGNTDIASLPKSAVNLSTGWVDFPRPKTGVERRCPLWPETALAVRDAIEQRPTPKDEADADLLFLTRFGRRWVRPNNNEVTSQFRKLLDNLALNGGRNFYALRHTFETVAGESRDQMAVNHIMGHADASMSAVYRERISDDRLLNVVEVVRAWLFPDSVETDDSDPET